MGAGPSPELRVEELAGQADVSVDTIRFYQKRRLLPPPTREGRVAWYDATHLERLARIRDLRAQGLTLALIGRVLDGAIDATDAPLAAAVAAADAESAEEFLTLDELAQRSGVPAALLEAVARDAGEDERVDLERVQPRALEGLPARRRGELARLHLR